MKVIYRLVHSGPPLYLPEYLHRIHDYRTNDFGFAIWGDRQGATLIDETRVNVPELLQWLRARDPYNDIGSINAQMNIIYFVDQEHPTVRYYQYMQNSRAVFGPKKTALRLDVAYLESALRHLRVMFPHAHIGAIGEDFRFNRKSTNIPPYTPCNYRSESGDLVTEKSTEGR